MVRGESSATVELANRLPPTSDSAAMKYQGPLVLTNTTAPGDIIKIKDTLQESSHRLTLELDVKKGNIPASLCSKEIAFRQKESKRT